MENSKINLSLGQIIKTQNRVVVIPEKLTYWEEGRPQESDSVCIRLTETLPDDSYADKDFFWTISTSTRKGLICWLPNQYEGCGILSVRINKVGQKSVNAAPVGWIELPNVKLGYEHTGTTVDKILSEAKGDYPEQEVIWHNKEA